MVDSVTASTKYTGRVETPILKACSSDHSRKQEVFGGKASGIYRCSL